MPSLRLLSLSINELGGTIPKELARMPVIEGLYLGWNEFVGEIPPELGNLSTLASSSIWAETNSRAGFLPNSAT